MPGTIVFRPIEATLTKDTDWLGKMDPFCMFVIGEQRIKGMPCKHGGTHPQWTDVLPLPFHNEPTAILELRYRDRLTVDDTLGTCLIDLNEIRQVGKVNKWYPIFYRNTPSGEVLIEATYEPLQSNIISQPVIPQQNLVSQPVIEKVTQVTTTETVIAPTTTSTTYVQGQGSAPIQSAFPSHLPGGSWSANSFSSHPLGTTELVSGVGYTGQGLLQQGQGGQGFVPGHGGPGLLLQGQELSHGQGITGAQPGVQGSGFTGQGNQGQL